MAKAIEVLRAHQSGEKSMWKEQAQWHVDNWGWLMHSTQIALSAKSRMVTLGMTQKELAQRMGCSQQYVSLILKGKENLTLETISKIEKELDCELIIHKNNIFSGYGTSRSSAQRYLNDSSGEDYEPELKPSTLVDGYKPLKKKTSKKGGQ